MSLATTLAPCAASAVTMTRPIAPSAPVIRTLLPARQSLVNVDTVENSNLLALAIKEHKAAPNCVRRHRNSLIEPHGAARGHSPKVKPANDLRSAVVGNQFKIRLPKTSKG